MSDPKKTTAPPVIGPPPTDAKGLADFHAKMDAALSQIKVDAPTGEVPPAPTIPNAADLRVNPEEQALLAHRATLAEEERRLEARRAANPMPAAGPVNKGLIPSAWGSAQAELVVREGADPLYVESFRTLRRLVAGGSPLLAAMDVPGMLKLIAALRDRIEYKGVVEPTAPTVVKKVVEG